MNYIDIIQKLNLISLPEEVGYFVESYRSTLQFIPPGLTEQRSACTAIYYLITPNDFSALHSVRYDEIFHFYAGDPAEMLMIDENGNKKKLTLGSLFNGFDQQVIVPSHTWQGLKLKPGGTWALLGTTVAPGSKFKDFKIDSRDNLIKKFPHLISEIQRYTR